MVDYTLCDTAIVPDHNPLFVPDFDTQFDLWPAIVIRIGRLGKSIAPRFAHRYVDAMAAGVVVQAHNVLRELASRGMPWMEGVSFDCSAPHGPWAEADLETCASTPLRFAVSPIREASPDSPPPGAEPYTLPLDLREVIASLSRLNTLKNGDIIYIAATPRSLTAEPDTRVTLWLGDKPAARIRVK